MRKDETEALRALPILRAAGTTDADAADLLLKIVAASYQTGKLDGMTMMGDRLTKVLDQC